MSQVNRGHLAGLRLVDELDGTVAISDLIAQASAAPEQDAVAWLVGKTVWENRSAAVRHAADRMLLVRPLYTHADDGELERLRAELAEAKKQLGNQRANTLAQIDAHSEICQQLLQAQALRWTPYLRGDSEPAPGVEVLVRYARQWPNDKVFFVTGAALHKSFDDRDDLFWFNGRGESMGGTVSHWMPMPSPDSSLSATAQPAEVKS